MKQLLLPLLPLILAQAACGALPSDDNKAPVLDTLKGEIRTQTTGLSPRNLRIAMVWHDARGNFTAAEDLAITPRFPAGFQLNLSAPPPASAMISFASDLEPLYKADASTPEAVHAAMGALVAYDDRNGNGKLDLVAAAATDFVDTIVGATSDARVVYIDRMSALAASAVRVAGTDNKLLGDDGSRPVLGYNVVIATTRVSGDSSVRSIAWRTAANAELVMDLTPSPELDGFMCEGYDGSSGAPQNPDGPTPNPDAPILAPGRPGGGTTGGNPDAPPVDPNQAAYYPAPNDPSLACTLDGTAFTYAAPACAEAPPSTPVERACGGDSTSVSNCASPSWSAIRPTPVPANWPCEAISLPE